MKEKYNFIQFVEGERMIDFITLSKKQITISKKSMLRINAIWINIHYDVSKKVIKITKGEEMRSRKITTRKFNTSTGYMYSGNLWKILPIGKYYFNELDGYYHYKTNL